MLFHAHNDIAETPGPTLCLYSLAPCKFGNCPIVAPYPFVTDTVQSLLHVPPPKVSKQLLRPRSGVQEWSCSRKRHEAVRDECLNSMGELEGEDHK